MTRPKCYCDLPGHEGWSCDTCRTRTRRKPHLRWRGIARLFYLDKKDVRRVSQFMRRDPLRPSVRESEESGRLLLMLPLWGEIDFRGVIPF